MGPVSFGTQTISTTVGKIAPGGIDGLGIVWAVPFNFGDYLVGFKVALANLSKTKMPDSLFAKRTIATPSPLDGSVTLDTDYNIAEKVFSADATWAAKSTDLELSASGNSVDQLTDVGFVTKVNLGETKTTLTGNYNLLKKKLASALKVDYAKTSAQMSYDTVDKDPILKMTQEIDPYNSFSPWLSFKTSNLAYSWTHILSSGQSVKTTMGPLDKVEIVWKDKGASGVWTTKLDVPLNDPSRAKVSLARDWNY